MAREIKMQNSLSGQKEIFEPIKEGYVGMYVCGPTVYNDVHLGNVRTFTSFDVIYRYLLYAGYKVRYVRNITDVGHLLDDGEDRMSKGARLEKLEPMEVAQKYTYNFHTIMRLFNNLSPSIEPRATGHIIEQIDMVQSILDNGYAYVVNGSVYFDTIKFARDTGAYGKLSGRIIEDLHTETRDLKNQGEKKHASDFAIWMKADDSHIMKWNSPWSIGFPGWHLECSAMSTKYLGKTFDIHGGGNDLKFPHHENEIAQNLGACKCQPANYWMHTNMLLMNGKKMSKSDGNTISPYELFNGTSSHVSKGYHPMIVKFFMLQTHYSSTLDLSDQALLAAEKGYKKLMDGYKVLGNLSGAKGPEDSPLNQEIHDLIDKAHSAMDDDFSTPRALAHIFEIIPKINGLNDGHLSLDLISPKTLEDLNRFMKAFIFDIFGFEEVQEGGTEYLDGVMQLLIELRADARANKDWNTSDKIRDALKALNIQLNDGSEGTTWDII